MPMDYPDMDSLEGLAKRLEVHLESGESEQDYRLRLGAAVVDVIGDTIMAGEVVIGKAWDKWDHNENSLIIKLHDVFSLLKAEKYKSQNDTNWETTWSEYGQILSDNGFEKVFSYDFEDTHSPDVIEEYAIWVKRDQGLFLTVESHSGKEGVNSTKLHYELQLPSTYDELDDYQNFNLDGVLNHSSNSLLVDADGQYRTFSVDNDVKEGLVSHLKKLEASGFQTNSPWRHFDQHFLFLSDYSETKASNHDYKAIAQNKITALPLDIQVMIGAYTPTE